MTRKLMWVFLIVFTLLTAYSTIVLYFDLGPLFNPLLTPLTTLVGFGFALLHARLRWNWRAALILFVISFVVTLAFESIGVATGLIYGAYHYTSKLGPKFLGLVPYTIPAAWFMMMYPSLVIAERISPQTPGWVRGLSVAAIGGLVMTAWDVVMDPMMVRGGHWTWETAGPYFGIPLQNYLGWWLTTFTVFFVNWLVVHRHNLPVHGQDDRLVVFVYALTGLSSVLIALHPSAIAQISGAGLAGFFAMAPWAIIGWIKTGDTQDAS